MRTYQINKIVQPVTDQKMSTTLFTFLFAKNKPASTRVIYYGTYVLQYVLQCACETFIFYKTCSVSDYYSGI